MSARRWDLPWTAPTGLAPAKAQGEPGFALLAVVHLAVWFGSSTLSGLVLAVGGANGWSLLAVAAAMLGAGAVALRRKDPLSAWVADLLLALGVGDVAGSVGVFADRAGASEATCVLLASAAALPLALALYARHRRVWLQVATVASAAALLVSALERDDTVPGAVPGLFLLILAGFVALGALSGVARPVGSGFVVAAVVAAAGAQVLLRADDLAGATVTLLLLAAVVWGVLQSRRESLLPVVLLSSTVLLPQVLAPVTGTGHAVLHSMALTGAGVALLAVDLQRRSVRPVQVGGVFVTCTVLVLLASFIASFGPSAGDAGLSVGDRVSLLMQALALGVLFVAAAAGRRRAATVISGLFFVPALPAALAAMVGGGAVTTAVLGLPCLGGAVWAAIWLDRQAPRPAASPWQQDASLSGPGRDVTVVAPYPQVFDAVVGVLGAAGVPLQLVDRAAGRVVAGDPLRPLLVVAVWASDPVRTQVRAVGAPWDVDRLEADVAARLNSLEAPH